MVCHLAGAVERNPGSDLPCPAFIAVEVNEIIDGPQAALVRCGEGLDANA